MSIEHVEEREGVYYVPGTRISLDSVLYAFREGCSPETIREDFAGLTLAHVYGAIAFYLDRPASSRASEGSVPGATTILEKRSYAALFAATADRFPARAGGAIRRSTRPGSTRVLSGGG